MSHPTDEGNSVVSRAFSAIRKRREEKAARESAAPRQRRGDQEPTPKQPEQQSGLSQDRPDSDSPTDPVGDSTDSPATETKGDAPDETDSTDTDTTDTDAADTDGVDEVDESDATPADQAPGDDGPVETGAQATDAGTDVDESATSEESADTDTETDEAAEDAPVADTADVSEGDAQDTSSEEAETDAATEYATDGESGPNGESEPETEGATATEPGAGTSPDAEATVPIPTGKATPAAAGSAATAKEPAAGDDIPGDENETAEFTAVPATATDKPANDKPIGSPADENKTEVIATDPSAPTEVIEAPTEKINIAKPAAKPTPAPTPAPARAPVSGWKAEPVAPQYIPAGGGAAQSRPSDERPKKSHKGLWVGVAALVAIVAVVAVVIGLVSAGGDSSKPAADVAAERALEYTTALREGDIDALRSITCGEAQARFANMSDEAFAAAHRAQEAHNELVGVDGVKASKIVEGGNSAVVEVSAYKTGTPQQKLDVALTLSKVDGVWKVCKA